MTQSTLEGGTLVLGSNTKLRGAHLKNVKVRAVEGATGVEITGCYFEDCDTSAVIKPWLEVRL